MATIIPLQIHLDILPYLLVLDFLFNQIFWLLELSKILEARIHNSIWEMHTIM